MALTIRTIVEPIVKEWGPNPAKRLGKRLYEALLNEQVLLLASMQDESVSAERVREIVVQGRDLVIDISNG